MNLAIKFAAPVDDTDLSVKRQQGDLVEFSEMESNAKPRQFSVSEVRDVLARLDPIFAQRMDMGWRPWITFTGDVCMLDGTVLYSDGTLNTVEGETYKVEWIP